MSVAGMLVTPRHGVDYNNTSPGYPQADKGGGYMCQPLASCHFQAVAMPLTEEMVVCL